MASMRMLESSNSFWYESNGTLSDGSTDEFLVSWVLRFYRDAGYPSHYDMVDDHLSGLQ
jgi:hypothetical protein